MKFVNQGTVGSPTSFIGTQAQASSLPGATVLQDKSVPEASMEAPGASDLSNASVDSQTRNAPGASDLSNSHLDPASLNVPGASDLSNRVINVSTLRAPGTDPQSAGDTSPMMAPGTPRVMTQMPTTPAKPSMPVKLK